MCHLCVFKCASLSLGWPLRNFLLLVAHCFELRQVTVICYRQDASSSMTLSLKIQYDPTVAVRKTAGWERNKANKLGPRLMDLQPFMDPVKLAESSVDLNIKLMRWRALYVLKNIYTHACTYMHTTYIHTPPQAFVVDGSGEHNQSAAHWCWNTWMQCREVFIGVGDPPHHIRRQWQSFVFESRAAITVRVRGLLVGRQTESAVRSGEFKEDFSWGGIFGGDHVCPHAWSFAGRLAG